MASAPNRTLYTVGHSSHTPEHFIFLLREHGVQVLVDTRSAPYSRYTPQFDREALRELLTSSGTRYLFLGDALGGRPRDESCYDAEGRVLYGRVARQPEFIEAIERLKRGADEFRVALMCWHRDPLTNGSAISFLIAYRSYSPYHRLRWTLRKRRKRA